MLHQVGITFELEAIKISRTISPARRRRKKEVGCREFIEPLS